MRNTLLFVTAIISLVTGCATYGAKGVTPNLGDPSSLAAKERVAVKAGEGFVVKVYPVVTEKEVKDCFDEDLLDNKILPIFVEIQTESENVGLIAATLNSNGITNPAMTPGDLYGVMKRDWFGRSTIWFFTTYGVGGVVSAIATNQTNKKIEQDLTGAEGSEDGKLLKFGKLPKGNLRKGFLCFRTPSAAANAAKLKLIFEKDGKLIEYNLDIN